jgi:hypothetical protein
MLTWINKVSGDKKGRRAQGLVGSIGDGWRRPEFPTAPMPFGQLRAHWLLATKTLLFDPYQMRGGVPPDILRNNL